MTRIVESIVYGLGSIISLIPQPRKTLERPGEFSVPEQTEPDWDRVGDLMWRTLVAESLKEQDPC
jgi:hypothetical protein